MQVTLILQFGRSCAYFFPHYVCMWVTVGEEPKGFSGSHANNIADIISSGYVFVTLHAAV